MLGNRFGFCMADKVNGCTSYRRNGRSGDVVYLTRFLIYGDAVTEQDYAFVYSFVMKTRKLAKKRLPLRGRWKL